MSEMLRIINPATEQAAGEYRRLNLPELVELVRLSEVAQREWAGETLRTRMDLCLRVCDFFETEAARIARMITVEMGKPIAQSRGEVRSMLARARAMIAQAPEALAVRHPESVDGFDRYVERLPHGVVLNMAAWNYPLLIAVNVVIPAVVAGNSVILKHSARTPGSGEIFAEAFRAAGAPDALVQSVQADHATMLALIAGEGVSYVAFTGSVAGGRAVLAAARERFIGVGLELGGKDGAYVTDQVDDLEWVAANLAEGFTYNAGQSCCAVERIYVHRKVYERFLNSFVNSARGWQPGDPLLEETLLGPLVGRAARAHIEAQASDARARGATVVLAGGPTQVNGSGFFYAPEVFTDVTHEMSLMLEENFGPIAGIMLVADDDEAVRLMNDSRFGLSASVWGTESERVRSVAARLSAGTVFLNRCDYLDPALPWTGYGDSGMGSTLGHEGYWNLTRPRSMHLRLQSGSTGA